MWTHASGQSRDACSKSSIMLAGPQQAMAVLRDGRPISAAISGLAAVEVS